MSLTAPIRKAARNALCALGRDVLAPVVASQARRRQGPEGPVSVHLLLSHASWRLALISYHSFEYFTRRRWNLFIHDDGSLDAAAISALQAGLPGARWVRRAEADSKVFAMLDGYPACRRLRTDNLYSLKLFDSYAFAAGSHYIVLDADVLFYDHPPEIIAWADERPRECWFNQEEKDSYGAPPSEIEAELGIRLWKGVNSGLCLFFREAFSLEWSERYLLVCERREWNNHLKEQALFAVNGSIFNQGGLLSQRYEISTRILHRSNSICRHYVGPFKKDILFVEGPANLLFKMTLPGKFA